MSYVDDTSVKSIVSNVLKQIGQKIAKGEITNIMSISKPAPLIAIHSLQECCAE